MEAENKSIEDIVLDVVICLLNDSKDLEEAKRKVFSFKIENRIIQAVKNVLEKQN